jgi:hypothetical protein
MPIGLNCLGEFSSDWILFEVDDTKGGMNSASRPTETLRAGPVAILCRLSAVFMARRERVRP